MNQDAQAIGDVVATWMKATRAGDLDTVLGLMTDDVVFLVQGRPPFGKEAFEQASRSQRNVELDGRSEIEEIEVMGDWAFLRSRLSITATPLDGGAPSRRSGHTLTILRKGADGRWRVARDANLLVDDAGGT